MTKHLFGLLLTPVALLILANAARAGSDQRETVEVFSAGSLRGVVGDLAREAGETLGIGVKASFGGSGAMRERIEKGEKADLLLSADLGSPRKLESQGRTIVPTIAFARNKMCIVARKASGLTAANLVDRLLDPKVRVKTSTPIVDPSGDYAWAIFDAIDRMRPGAGAILKDKAQALTSAVTTTANPPPGAIALFTSGQIDLSIAYCSGSAAMEKELPELMSLEVPAQLDPHPTYGIAVLTSSPAAMRLALYLLSEKGQEIIAREKLIPILDAYR